MVASNWGDWFLSEEIEAETPDSLSVWYMGCNSFVVRSSETTLYIDPYFGNGDPPWTIRMTPVTMDPNDATICDGILITHEHLDHMHPPSYRPLIDNTDAHLYAPASGYETPDYEGKVRGPGKRRNLVEHGASIEFSDLTVHVRKTNDPDADESVGYVIEHDSGTFFNAGDARPGEGFKAIGREFDIDDGTLAFGTRGHLYVPENGQTERVEWYQDENQVVKSSNQLQLSRLLPCHYDMWKNVGADPKSLHDHIASHAYPSTMDTIKVGDRITVGKNGIEPLHSLNRRYDGWQS